MANYSIKCNAGTSVFFDFDNKVVKYNRTGSLNATLGVIDVEIPFADITGFIVKKPSLLMAGSVSLIVNGKGLFTHTGKDSTNTDLTEAYVQSAGYKVFEQAIESFRKEVKDIPVRKKGEIKVEKAHYVASNNPYETDSKEYRVRCNVCGHIYCFTNRDLKDNVQAAKLAKMSAVGEMAGALSGNWGAAVVNSQNANNELNNITDYSRCPKCNSTNITVMENGEPVPQAGSNGTSSADELKKFKELLDSGVISREEFDAKKKQLLGL